MSVAWRKVIRDSWRERTRTILVILAIALGIAAFASVLSSWAILTRELDRGYLATNPAAGTFHVDEVTNELVAAVRGMPGVADAQARRALTAKIRTGPASWKTLRLFVVDDFGDVRVSRVVPQEGAWPPAAGEILIERDALRVASAEIGASVMVRTPNGDERSLRVAGTVHDPGQAQARMENIVYGYVTLETLVLLGEEGYFDRILIAVSGNPLDETHVRAVASEVSRRIEILGAEVYRVDVPQPGKHPHADIMGLLLLIKAGFGLFALVLSGILVINLLTALMAAQVRQIGIMKTIGASRAAIARIYLGQAALLGAAALVVAIPAAVWGTRLLTLSQATLLNFDIDSFAVPLWIWLVVVAAGLLVPLLAAGYPVWRGTGVAVREALADFGVARSAFGTTALDRILARRGGLTRPLLLSIRNSFRRRSRLVLTVITLAVGGVFLMAGLNVRASLVRTLDVLFEGRKSDLSVSLASMVPFEKLERAARSIPGVLRTEGWITTEGSLADAGSLGSESPHGGGLHGAEADRDRFTVIALPPETDLLTMQMVAGRPLRNGDGNAVVVNHSLAANDSRIEVGAMIPMRLGHAPGMWRVVGIAREPLSPAVAYVPLGRVQELGGMEGLVNNLRVVVAEKDPDSIDLVEQQLDRELEREGVRALASSSKADSRYGFDQHMLMIYVFLIVVAAIFGAVGGLGMMTTMSLGVIERRREMGVLRAIGASPRVVWLLLVVEGVAIGMLSWLLAVLAAWPLSRMVGDFLVLRMLRSALDFRFDPLGPAIWLAVSLLISAVASFVPAWRASRRSVREAIAWE